MKTVFKYLAPYKFRMAFGLFLKAVGTLAELVLPLIMAYMIDEIAPTGKVETVIIFGVLMLGCAFIAWGGNVAANRMASKVARDTTEKLRRDLFRKTLYLSARQSDFVTVPSLVSRLSSDTYNVHQMIGMMQRLGVRAPILLIGGVAMTFIIDPVLALVLLASVPVLTIIVIIVSKKGSSLYTNLQKSVDGMVRKVRDDYTGIRVIKALSKTEYESDEFKIINDKVVKNETKAGITMGVTNPLLNMILNLGMTLVVLVGAYRVLYNHVQVGEIIAFTSFFTIILNAVISVSRIFVNLSKGNASAKRIEEVLLMPQDLIANIILKETQKKDYVDSSVNNGNGKTDEILCGREDGNLSLERKWRRQLRLNRKKGKQETTSYEDLSRGNKLINEQKPNKKETEDKIVCKDDAKSIAISSENKAAAEDYVILFDNVSFSYDESALSEAKYTIKNLSFGLKKGESLGIIGATGSGKSTIVSLLLRFYDVSKGGIYVDGVNIKNYEEKELRKKFGVVFQTDFLMASSIKENIDFKRDLKEEDLKNAAEYAKASDFIEALKEGYDSKLTARGANFSGGQKQRLLIARALAGSPQIIILDDSSSALDYKTDALLRKTLLQKFPQTTVIMIAQRISSVRFADKILLMDKGEKVAFGSDKELMQTCELYRSIYNSQHNRSSKTGNRTGDNI